MSRVDISAWGAEPPLFIRLLAAEASCTDKSKAAARIGMSRTAVSLVLANKYTSPSTAGVERRVMEVLGRIECAAVAEPITVEQCQSYRARPAPTHNPQSMQHWRACQQCPMNPNCTGGGHATVH
ncbi:hypothetical protein [Phytopseudomonas flavescens]|uniref:hypothetical protein n=1 Tax=Phytopseudomonas flavescens TaxID=29435 RepID=UPI000A05F338|nr:hypothetical protein [Pseudomonas flavescens]